LHLSTDSETDVVRRGVDTVPIGAPEHENVDVPD